MGLIDFLVYGLYILMCTGFVSIIFRILQTCEIIDIDNTVNKSELSMIKNLILCKK